MNSWQRSTQVVQAEMAPGQAALLHLETGQYHALNEVVQSPSFTPEAARIFHRKSYGHRIGSMENSGKAGFYLAANLTRERK